MSQIFSRSFRVRFAEADPNGYVNPAHYLRYLVETAYDWGASLKLGLVESEALEIIWVIRETYFEIMRPLRYNEVFAFSIWMVSWRRVRGYRSFELTVPETGEVVARGGQQIACLDARTFRPTAPPVEVINPFRIENPRVIAVPRFPKVEPNRENSTYLPVQVGWRDLDMYDQLNNAVYADYAREALIAVLAEAGWPPSRLRAENLAVVEKGFHIRYLSRGGWGDKLRMGTEMRRIDAMGVEQYLMITHEDGTRVMEYLSEWGLRDRETGEPTQFPDPLREALAK